MNRKILTFSVLLAFVSGAFAADKIATVDLETAIGSHPDTDGNKETLRDTQKKYEDQRDALRDKVERLQENFVQASEQANNPALNEKARETQKNIAREILGELQKEEHNLKQLIARLQRSLNETELLLFEGTMKTIDEKIAEISKERGITLVLDKSAIRPGAPVPVVLWSAPTIDITEELVKRIGGTIKPAELQE